MGLHICMISPEFASGGIGNYVYNLSKKLIEKRHKVTVLTRGSIKKTNKKVIDGIPVYDVSMLPLYPFHICVHGFFVNSVFKSLKSEFNMVHLHSPILPIIKTDLPILATVHTLYTNDTASFDTNNFYSYAERLQSLFLSSLELKNLKNSKKITTVSSLLIKELEDYKFNIKNVSVLGNGVNEKIFYPTKNLKYKNKYILYVGRIGFRKGIFNLMECAKNVLKEHQNVKFIMVGTGPLLNQLRKKVRNMNLQKKILLLGYIKKERLLQLYRGAYIHLIPSAYEGLPNVLLEAMSSGIPVVANNVGGISDVISSGVNGFLVSSKNPSEMIKVINKLLENVNLRNKIGKNARKTIEKYYTWDIMAEKFLENYYSII
ncbi:MAG: glycosyltransferase family 4 protein [Candidatus Hodarchaeota archaeon]